MPEHSNTSASHLEQHLAFGATSPRICKRPVRAGHVMTAAPGNGEQIALRWLATCVTGKQGKSRPKRGSGTSKSRPC